MSRRIPQTYLTDQKDHAQRVGSSNIEAKKKRWNVEGDAQEAAAQMSSSETPFKAAQDVVTPRVEWHLTPAGNGRPVTL